jgi:putative membrane protein
MKNMFEAFINEYKKLYSFLDYEFKKYHANIKATTLLTYKILKTMKLYSNLILSFSFCALSACTNHQAEKDADTNMTAKKLDSVILKTDSSVPLDSADISFLENAAYGGMMEVEGSNKILQLTKDQKVKAFAEMMTKDHGNANKKLKELATVKGYELPSVLPNSKLKSIDQLTTFKDEGRDEFYLQLMVAEHKNAVNLFSLASRSDDAEIAEFAKTLLPTLNMHLQEVMRLDSVQKLPKVNQGDDPLKLSNRKKN